MSGIETGKCGSAEHLAVDSAGEHLLLSEHGQKSAKQSAQPRWIRELIHQREVMANHISLWQATLIIVARMVNKEHQHRRIMYLASSNTLNTTTQSAWREDMKNS